MSKFKKASLGSVFAFLVPAALMAVPRGSAMNSALSSRTGDASREATVLLNQIEHRAREIRNAIDPLNLRVRYNQVDVDTQSEVLNEVREHVNAMGRDLKRLEELRDSARPWQKQEIDRITPVATALAKDTESAIRLFDRSLSHAWATALPDEYAAVDHDARRIAQSVSRVEAVAKLKKEMDQLQPKG
jgi:hypothetical protein